MCDCQDTGDVGKWKVKELKAYLNTHKVSYQDCLEKSDFVSRVKETQRKQAEAARTDKGTDVFKTKVIFGTKQVGPLKCNMVILGDPETKEAVLVDPGGDAHDIIAMVDKLGVKVTQILVTHGHFDHFLAATEVKKHTGAPVCLHAADIQLWQMLSMQCMMFGMQAPSAPVADPDVYLEHGNKLSVLGGTVIHTPGHSKGSCCFHFEAQGLLLAGDTLFKGSVGRTDLPGGDAAELASSIRKRLYCLADDTKVIPGHGDTTTIGWEKANNPVVRPA